MKERRSRRAQAAANTRKLIEWAAEAVSKPLPEPVRRRAATSSPTTSAPWWRARSSRRSRARAKACAHLVGQGRGDGARQGRAARRPLRRGERERHGDHLVRARRGFRNASCHGGAYTIPALLAEAEAQGRTVEEVLRALAVAYEVTTRFALAFPFPVFNVHPHAAFATIGGGGGGLARAPPRCEDDAGRGHRRRRACPSPARSTPRSKARSCATPGPRPAPGSACAPRTGPRPASAAAP